jgi:hypothetical protein
MVTVDSQGDHVNLGCLMEGVFFVFDEIFPKYKEGNHFRESDGSALRV